MMTIKRIEDRHLKTLVPLLKEFHNETDDFNSYHFRTTLKPYLTIIVTLYAVILLLSICGNFFMCRHIVRTYKRRNKSDQLTFNLIFGNCVNDILIKDLLVMPASLLILLTVHWTQGELMCYTFPLIQDACFYATSLTFLLIFYNRYKIALRMGLVGSFNELSSGGSSCPWTAFWNLVIAWSISFLGVLPYTAYIEFIDLSDYLILEESDGEAGFCVVNLDGNIQEYIRCLFISFYVLPAALVAYFHARTSTLLKTWPANETGGLIFDTMPREGVSSSSRRMSNVTRDRPVQIGNRSGSSSRRSSSNNRNPNNPFTDVYAASPTVDLVELEQRPVGSLRFDVEEEPSSTSFADDIQNNKSSLTGLIPSLTSEKGCQSLLVIMFSIHAVSLLPINILRISKHVVVETRENSVTFDVLFVIFVAIQFSSTALIPLAYYFWTSGLQLIQLATMENTIDHHRHGQHPRNQTSLREYPRFEFHRPSTSISNDVITTLTDASPENNGRETLTGLNNK